MMSRSHVQFNLATFGYRYFIFIIKSRQSLSINYILCRRCLAAANAEIIVSTLMLCITSFSSERSERLISHACPIVDRRWFLTNLSFKNDLSPLQFETIRERYILKTILRFGNVSFKRLWHTCWPHWGCRCPFPLPAP